MSNESTKKTKTTDPELHRMMVAVRTLFMSRYVERCPFWIQSIMLMGAFEASK